MVETFWMFYIVNIDNSSLLLLYSSSMFFNKTDVFEILKKSFP